MADGLPTTPPSATAEAVALRLLELIANAEGRNLTVPWHGAPGEGRRYILDTFAECLAAVRGTGPAPARQMSTAPAAPAPGKPSAFTSAEPDQEPFDEDD